MNSMVEVSDYISQAPECLLDAYQPATEVYFSSKTRTLLARPPFASLLVTGMNSLSRRVEESLRFATELGFKESVVVGAIPFDVSEQAYLRVSTNYLAESGRDKKTVNAEPVNLGQCQVKEKPAAEAFKRGVSDALARFAKGELDKVVLSRTLEVNCEHTPNVRALVKKLAAKNTHGYTFAVDLYGDHKRNKRTLIGASPELLISRRGNKVVAHPLAGSEPRSANPEVDKSRANALMQSKKDRFEHALVVQAIADVLRPLCKNLHVPQEPSLVSTETMWHLASLIEGELKNEHTGSLELALALHPTPAVGGYPTQNATKAIKQTETHSRGLFTGMVGWCDASGDGEWVVTIRCAEVENKKITLYAGAGIVEGSCPEKELAETGAKFNTMLNALGMPMYQREAI